MNLNKQRYFLGWVIVILSALYLVATTIWVLKEPPLVLMLMEILTMLSALAIVGYFAVLYRQTTEGKRTLALLALLLAGAMAVVTISNHFVYMTVISTTYGTLSDTPELLRLDGWPSVTKALECVSWAAMLGTAMLLLSFALEKDEQAAKWILRISGILILIGLIGPFSGNMQFYFFSTIGYTVGFLVLALSDIRRGHHRI